MEVSRLLIIVVAVIAALQLMWSKRAPKWGQRVIILLILLSACLSLALESIESADQARKARVGELESQRDGQPPGHDVDVTTWELGTDFKEHPGMRVSWNTGLSFANFKDPTTIPLRALCESGLTLEAENGQLKVSMLVRNRRGEVVAALVRNKWIVNQALDRNYSKDMLEVVDNSGAVVLQLRLLPDRVQMNAMLFSSDGTGLAIFPTPRMGEWSPTLCMIGPDNLPALDTLKPMFKYPSEFHLGEFAE